jgi:fatty acid desaturase
MTNFSWLKAIVWSVIPMMIFSACFTFCSQLNHITQENVEKFSSDWYEHQIITSHTFAPDSLFWFIVTGGLNLQSEHHVFPGVNQWHLRKLQPVVEQCCKDHGVPYHKSDTAWIAFKKHISHLSNMALKE